MRKRRNNYWGRNTNKKVSLLSEIQNDNVNNIYNENLNSNDNSIILKKRKLRLNDTTDNFKEKKSKKSKKYA